MRPENGGRPPSRQARNDLPNEPPTKALANGFNDNHSTSQDARLAPERLAFLARRVHALGERPLLELLRELERGAELHSTLERYGGLPADFIAEWGGHRLPTPRAITGGRR